MVTVLGVHDPVERRNLQRESLKVEVHNTLCRSISMDTEGQQTFFLTHTRTSDVRRCQNTDTGIVDISRRTYRDIHMIFNISMAVNYH